MKKILFLLILSVILSIGISATTVNFQLNRNDASSFLGIPLEDTTGVGVAQFWGLLLNAGTDSMVWVDISSFISAGGEIPLDSIFQYMDPNYFDTSTALIFCTFSDSTGKIDTNYTPFQTYVNNNSGISATLENIFNLFDKDYVDTLNDSIIIVFSDSTGKIDTNYAPFQEYITNNAGVGVTLANVFNLFDRDYSDTLNDSIINIFSDSTGKIDTNYVPFQTYVANNGGAGLTLEGVFNFFDRDYSDTLNDSIIIVFSDSTGKIDTGYIPFQSFIANYIDTTTLDTIPTSRNTMMATFNGATYRTYKDYMNISVGHGLISGGIITDAGSGLIDITAGTGFVKQTDNDLDSTLSFDFSSNLGVGLTDSSSNFIYIVYNGGSPIVNITTTLGVEFFAHDRILIGAAHREGNVIDTIGFPNQIKSFNNKVVQKDVTLAGGREEVVPNTLLISSDSLYLTFTAGQFFYGLSGKTSPAFNSDTTMVDPDDLWTTWYNDGAWQKTINQFKVDSLQYNDFGTGLTDLANSRFGVHYAYITANGTSFHIVYGTGSYTQAEADTVSVPPSSSIPPKLADFGFFIGKIIVAKDAQSVITLSPFKTILVGSGVDSHNSLADLLGGAPGDYNHLTSVELNNIDTALFSWLADSSLSGIIRYRNDTSITIIENMPVRITGFNLGNNVINVKPAMSRDSSSMPAVGVATADIIAGSVSTSISFGSLIDTPTDTIGAAGDNIYVDTAGGLTNMKPKAPFVIQKIGEIGRSHAINGQLFIFGAGRQNDVPQLLPGEIFYGAADSSWKDTTLEAVVGPFINDSSDVIRAEIKDSLDNVIRDDGTIPMAADLDMGGNNITNVATVQGNGAGTLRLDFGFTPIIDSTLMDSIVFQLGRFNIGVGSVDSTRIGYGLENLSDVTQDTIVAPDDTVRVDTTIIPTFDALNDSTSTKLKLDGTNSMTGNLDMNDNSIEGIDSLIGGAGTPSIDYKSHVLDSTLVDSIVEQKGVYDISNPTLNNVLISGDLGASNGLYSLGFGNRLNLEEATVQHADTYQYIPIWDILWDAADSAVCIDSSQAVHPSYLYSPSGFLGTANKKQILAYTPFCIGESDEDPFVVWKSVADDGTVSGSWEEIIIGTDTLHNPVMDQSDVGASHLSDEDIFFDADFNLWLIFRATWDLVTDTNAIYISKLDTTGGGISFSTPVKILSDGILGTAAGANQLISPSVVPSDNSSYIMYVVEPHMSSRTSNPPAPGIFVRYKNDGPVDSLDSPTAWYVLDTINIPAPHDSLKHWHADFIPRGKDEILALLTCTDTLNSNFGGESELYLATSYDGGATFDYSASAAPALEIGGSAWYGQNVYRSSGAWIDDGSGGYLDLYYSASQGGNWHIGNTQLFFSSAAVSASESFVETTIGDSLTDYATHDTVKSIIDDSLTNYSTTNEVEILIGDSLDEYSVTTAIRVMIKDSLDGYRTKKVIIHADWIGGRTGIPAGVTDSVHLSFPIMDGINSVFAKDSSTRGTSFSRDSLYITWGALPFDIVSVDSVVFTYKNTTTTNNSIDAMYAITPDQSSSSVMADSLHSVDIVGASINSTTWAEARRNINLSLINPGEQFVLKMENTIADGENIWIGRIYLICTVNLLQ